MFQQFIQMWMNLQYSSPVVHMSSLLCPMLKVQVHFGKGKRRKYSLEEDSETLGMTLIVARSHVGTYGYSKL